MKLKNNNKRGFLIIMSLLIIGFIIIGVSYAIWQVTLTQTDKNTVTSGCFKVEFTDTNPISLDKAYPITDEEGKKLSPYTFTIKNNCNNYAAYQVNLEELKIDEKRLSNKYIKMEINNKINSLKDLTTVSPTISNADISHKIAEGVLEPKEEKTYTLKLWLKEDTPPIDEVLSATFKSKITITSTYQNNIIIPYLDNIKAETIPSKDDKYVFENFECNNQVTLNWDDETWNYTLENTSINSEQNVCKLYFKTKVYEVVFYSETATFENNLVLTNLIQNGSFENGFDNWELITSGNTKGVITNKQSVSGINSLYVNDPAAVPSAFWLKQIPVMQPSINDILYISGYFFNVRDFLFQFQVVDNSNGNALLSIENMNENSNFEFYSAMGRVSNSNSIRIQVGDGLRAAVETYFDNALAINLTFSFGSGMEPTQEWIDKYIPYFDTLANIAVESIEKQEKKSFGFTQKKEVSIECTNANYKIIDNTIEISGATGDVYCKLS